MHREQAILISGNDRPLMFQKLFWKGMSMTANPERCSETKFLAPPPVDVADDDQPKKKKTPPPPPPPPPPATAADPHADDEFDELDVIPPTPPTPPTPKPIPLRIRRKEKTPWDDFDEHTIFQVEPLPPPPGKA
jgi:hypothetical protein